MTRGIKPVPAELNDPALLEEISERWWPEHRGLTGEKLERALGRLRLAHPPASSPQSDFLCKRCGGKTLASYSAKRFIWMCLQCRQKLFPLAPDPSDPAVQKSLATALAALGGISNFAPSNSEMPPRHDVECMAACLHQAAGHCYLQSTALRLDQDGTCAQRAIAMVTEGGSRASGARA